MSRREDFKSDEAVVDGARGIEQRLMGYSLNFLWRRLLKLHIKRELLLWMAILLIIAIKSNSNFPLKSLIIVHSPYTHLLIFLIAGYHHISIHFLDHMMTNLPVSRIVNRCPTRALPYCLELPVYRPHISDFWDTSPTPHFFERRL